jgi:hypothetical protein
MENIKLVRLMLAITASLLLMACLPVQRNVEPTVDVVGTTAAQLASMMLTQTAAAVTPTPLPPTVTPAPLFTETPSLPPTPTVTSIPKISGATACYAGPGSQYPLVSNISDQEEVYVIGVGNVPGWYVIENPYYGSQCWVSAQFMYFESDFDISTLPTIVAP